MKDRDIVALLSGDILIGVRVSDLVTEGEIFLCDEDYGAKTFLAGDAGTVLMRINLLGVRVNDLFRGKSS